MADTKPSIIHDKKKTKDDIYDIYKMISIIWQTVIKAFYFLKKQKSLTFLQNFPCVFGVKTSSTDQHRHRKLSNIRSPLT